MARPNQPVPAQQWAGGPTSGIPQASPVQASPVQASPVQASTVQAVPAQQPIRAPTPGTARYPPSPAAPAQQPIGAPMTGTPRYSPSQAAPVQQWNGPPTTNAPQGLRPIASQPYGSQQVSSGTTQSTQVLIAATPMGRPLQQLSPTLNETTRRVQELSVSRQQSPPAILAGKSNPHPKGDRENSRRETTWCTLVLTHKLHSKQWSAIGRRSCSFGRASISQTRTERGAGDGAGPTGEETRGYSRLMASSCFDVAFLLRPAL